MASRYLIILFTVFSLCNFTFGYEWQIEPFGQQVGRPDPWCLANVDGAPTVVFFGESEEIDEKSEWPINYAIHTPSGWEVETVVPASEKPNTNYLCLASLPSGNPAVCYVIPGHTWYSIRTGESWQREEVIDGQLHPSSPRGLLVRNDGTPIILNWWLDTWYRDEGVWRFIRPRVRSAPGVGLDGFGYDMTMDGQVIACGDFWIPIEGIGGEYGCASTIGNDWTFFKTGAMDAQSKIKAFDDGHIGIAYAKHIPGTQGPDRAGLQYLHENNFSWKTENIEDISEYTDNYVISNLISLPNGEPAIAYSCLNTQDSTYYLKYAWRENSVWQKNIIALNRARNPALQLINGLPYIGYCIQIGNEYELHFAYPIPNRTLTVNVEPNDIGIDTLTPNIGQNVYYENDVVSLRAANFVKCPKVYRFEHWEGDVNDANSPSTTVIMDSNQTVTAFYSVDSPKCGDECHPNFLLGDSNHDCIVNFRDVGMVASRWLNCTKPECD
ncbi:MAG: hypothetical protein ACYSWZ_14110 [Planctomycetota bacterium]|jgi:hypothetical protein